MAERGTRRRALAAALAAFLAAGAAAGAAGGASCPPTEPNAQGPFYLPGAPRRVAIAPGDEPGERLAITGRVLTAAGCAPLAGAVVEVWQASDAGVYYGLEGGRRAGADPWRLRGSAVTGADGAYRFETVLPGRYPFAPGLARPRHVHFLVSHPAQRPLVTQLYFAGDPALENDELVRPSLVRPLAVAPGGVGGAVVFDLVLAPR